MGAIMGISLEGRAGGHGGSAFVVALASLALLCVVYCSLLSS
jgi:hypothetical protein